MYEHGHSSGHCFSVDNFSVVGREVHSITRTITEAMFIRVKIHTSAGTWASSSSPTSGMRSCKTPLPSIPSNTHCFYSTVGPHNLHTTRQEAHTFHVGKYGPHPGSPSSLAPLFLPHNT